MRHLAGITSILYIQLSYDQPDLQGAFERALEKIWSIKNLRKQDRYRAIRELIMDAPNLVGERIHKCISTSFYRGGSLTFPPPPGTVKAICRTGPLM